MTVGLINMASQKGPRFQVGCECGLVCVRPFVYGFSGLQVVRLPGQFTRGRWDCWDYREQEEKVEDAGVLVFDSSGPPTASAPHPDAPSTVPITGHHAPAPQLTSNSTSVSPSNSNLAVSDTSSDTIVVTSIAQVQPLASPDVSCSSYQLILPLAGPDDALFTAVQLLCGPPTSPSERRRTTASSW